MTNELELPKNVLQMPEQEELNLNFNKALQLVDDIILKKYVSKLKDFEIVELSDREVANNLSNIRLFRITEMVYEKDENSTYKFASVFNALATAKCAVFVIIDSNGEKTDFYMGIRSLESDKTTSSLSKILKNAVIGQFPGTKTEDYFENDIKRVVSKIKTDSISIVSCLANNRDNYIKDNQCFVQGLEKLALSMQGEKYTAVILANGTTHQQIEQIRSGYESIYTQLSPYANQQMAFSTNNSISLSDAYTYGTSHGTSYSENSQTTHGTTTATSTSESSSVSELSDKSKINTCVANAVGAVASILLSDGVAYSVGQAMSVFNKTSTKSSSSSHSESTSESETKGETYGTTDSENESNTNTKSLQSGSGRNLTLTLQNKKIIDILERLDTQLKRLQEFESLGMWECAAYFMSENPYAAEIAASTYKAIMRGENSGIEISAINSWDNSEFVAIEKLTKYITNFMHPVFKYHGSDATINLTPSVLVSGNELALHMGLPRKSVCGFPVIEHADFGKEIVSYNVRDNTNAINLGKVFNMGSETDSTVHLNCKSLAMHTFITGSTGSGKSNTVYEILRQLKYSGVSFMVIEPAKGEYKNIFGNDQNVEVFGTNPQYSKLLQINPFKFPKGIHVLEHIDRLIEIFNVCWPMYAAMPAVLKDAVLQAYEVCGWDLVTSENKYFDDLFPTFLDLQSELIKVISGSAYSQEVKGNYIGSLLTRVKSLTNGLNGQIFGAKEIHNNKLFDENVIVDLSRVGSTETKSLIMGVLVMRLNEHRMSTSEGMNNTLKHITILEEAHNILKRTSAEQNPESSNMAGKSVEMISNAIAEMRTYGEGFIIADQSPNAVDISAIRNTNTKIIMRLPDESDRHLAGKAAALNDEQINEIAKLPCGVAVVYQNDWIEPVLCKVKKYSGTEALYNYHQKTKKINIDEKQYKTELLKLLLKGRTIEQLEPDIDLLQEQLNNVSLSTKHKIGILYFINEYARTDKLEIWKDEKFDCLSKIVFELLNTNGSVENLIATSRTFNDITAFLSKEISKHTENLSDELKLSVCHCLMKEFSKENDEKLTIYAAWRKEVVNKEVF